MADAVDALIAHLDAERQSLEALDTLLSQEAEALARLDAPTLISLAQEKRRLVESHALLSEARAARLAAVDPEGAPICLSQLSVPLARAHELALADARCALVAVLGRVRQKEDRNRTFAESGAALVQAALTALGRRLPNLTYSRQGTYRRPDGALGPGVKA